MVEFAYNNAKNISTSHTPFKLNCGYYSYMSYVKDINPYSRLKSAEELSSELQQLMSVCRGNLYHS